MLQKRILALLLTIVMLVCSMPANECMFDLFGIEASAENFVPRLTAPSRTGYYSNNSSINPYSVNTSAG